MNLKLVFKYTNNLTTLLNVNLSKYKYIFHYGHYDVLIVVVHVLHLTCLISVFSV